MTFVYNATSTINEQFPEITQGQETFISKVFTNLASLYI